MRVLLVNPPWKKGLNRYGVRAGSRWPFTVCAKDAKSLGYIPFPFFLAYTTALLEKEQGIDVKAVDAIAEGLDDAAYFSKVESFNPDVVLAESSTPSFTEDVRYASETKKLTGKALIYVLAGPHVSIFPAQALEENPEIDYCLIGEYEWTARDLVRWFKNGGSRLGDIKGLAYREEGRVVVSERRQLGDINELPWPAWHHFPMKNYRDYFCSIPSPMVNMVGSRGCPFTCNFCMWPDVMYGGHLYRTRDIKNIVDEMEYLVKTYNFKTIYFDDDTFNIGKRRMLDFCGEIRARCLKVKWAIMARADTVDEETLVAMKKTGLYAVKYGVESGNQQILDLTGKKLKLEDVRRTVLTTKKLGIKVHLTFTIGLSGENHGSLEDTVRLLKELEPDSAQFSICTPFPGTKYYEESKTKGFLLVKDLGAFDGSNSCVLRTAELTKADIEAGLARLLREWLKIRMKNLLLHPGRIIGILKNPSSVWEYARVMIGKLQ